ncbi:hypothetical protein LIER_37240 [Lithospermum erythrorhizon]|uniref:Reverse transcriptase RNase H-like domain-containing protein n=1 Tax=Lithospermum erythrorhizon TaxID=34254 RepID=A0AAV3PKJ7_LITER
MPFGLKNVGATYQRAMKKDRSSPRLENSVHTVTAISTKDEPLILYVVAQELSVGALLAQENEEGKENALYYLSGQMTPNKLNYSPIEKLCLALVFTI